MSKLFDTLEKIRRQETYHVPKGTGAFQEPNLSGSNRKTKPLVVAAVSGTMLVAAASVLLFLHLLRTSNPEGTDQTIVASTPASQSSPITAAPERPLASTARPRQQTGQPQSPGRVGVNSKTTSPAEQIAALNNLGVETIRAKQDYWKGLYLLNLAKEKDPSRIEPLINMAVALNELGLTGPANRHLAEARAIDPGHPALQRNLEILAQAGIRTQL